ncbi:MAG: aromatic ring-hydroxylating dioxygenase subunit alpha [Hyphomicrobiales bacterium]|nr:aromatic ring-hydroxylating dioxygenase subunit alpha [Hyphomicrobiales bacterium]MBV8426945.1 aromatic ring-hydroxylating dioxygenase subunit alpha [Hyphomicrobiales bacterium]
MLDLARIRALLQSRVAGHTLPQEFYTDPDIFEFDLEAIHSRCWILAGLECELPSAGSYLAITIGRSPIVIVRDNDGTLRAFHNTCRHRGAQICEQGHGRKTRLVCPYHQWTYRLDGSLQAAARMQPSFDPSGLGLRPVPLENVAGSLYVCLADDPPRFDEFRDRLTPLLAPHHLADAKLAHESTLVERANWKLVMENARECYHCAARHPGLSVPFPVWRGSRLADSAIVERFEARMEAVGLSIGPVQGDWWQASRFPLNDGFMSLTPDGKPCVSKPMCQVAGGDVGSLRWALEPHSFCHALGEYVVMFSAMPTAPQETIVTCKWFVHKDAVEGVDYTLDGLTRLWNETNLQDRDLAENNQRGVNGRGYRPGPYSEEAEHLVIRLVDWYCAQAGRYLDDSAGRASKARLVSERKARLAS